MPVIADMVAKMLSEGCSAEAIVAAVNAVESVTLSSRDASRSVTHEQARVRALNYRNRKRIQQVAKANDVATASIVVALPSVTRHVTQPIAPLTTSLLFRDIDEGEEGKKESVNARARGTRLQAGQPLTQPFIQASIECGAPADAAAGLWTEFVDYWSEIPGARGCKISWLGTWRNNVKRAIAKGFLKNRTGPPAKPLTQHQIERQESREILNDLQKFIDDSSGRGGDADPGLLRLDPGDGQKGVHGGVRGDIIDVSARRGREGD